MNNIKQAYNYTVLLEKEEDGGYHAFCPILKGFDTLSAEATEIPE